MATEAVEEAQVPVGLLDQPVLMEGKRKRKATKQFSVEATTPRKKVAIKHVGNGVKLEDIPSVDHTLTEKFKADELRMLYKLCFEVNGKASTLKKELKQFQGFEFDKDSEEYKKKKVQLDKLTKSGLASQFCAPLCLQDKGSKEELVDRIMEFLLCPTDHGKAAASDVKKKKVQQKKKSTKAKADKSTDRPDTTAATASDNTTEETKSSDEPTANADEDDKEEDDDKE